MAIIYKITNKVDNKCYIGFTTKTLEFRWTKHVKDAERGSELFFHRAIRKYGPESFYKEILTESDNEEFLLNIMESQYIAMYKSNNSDYGYNMTSGGESTLGHKHSEETKQKLREQRLGEKSPIFGKKQSQEHKEKRKLFRSGEDHPRTGKTSWNKGIPRTEEERKKISESHKGKKMPPRSPEHSRKISEANKGKPKPRKKPTT